MQPTLKDVRQLLIHMGMGVGSPTRSRTRSISQENPSRVDIVATSTRRRTE